MSQSTIALRYARALLDIGIKNKNFEQLGRELDRVVVLFKSADLRELFRNPKFSVDARKKVLSELLRRVMVSPITRNFLHLLVDRGRIHILPTITKSYHDIADAQDGRIRAHVTVAEKLSEPDAARLRAVLRKLTGQQVIIEQSIDVSLLGGVVTRIGGKVYDGSVQAQLESMRTQLKQANR